LRITSNCSAWAAAGEQFDREIGAAPDHTGRFASEDEALEQVVGRLAEALPPCRYGGAARGRAARIAATFVRATHEEDAMTIGRRPLIFECIERNGEAIRGMGARIIAENRRLGVPSHYMDRELCVGIIREMPDGSRQEIALHDGVEMVLRELPPA
jgi:hypothetical protein